MNNDPLFALCLATGSLLATSSFESGCSSSTHVDTIFDYVFELICQICDGSEYDHAVLFKRHFLAHLDKEEVQKLFKFLHDYALTMQPLARYTEFWRGKDLSFDNFLNIPQASLRETLKPGLVIISLFEDHLGCPGQFSAPYIDYMQDLDLRSPNVFANIFKPIFVLLQDGIACNVCPWRFVEKSTNLLIDLSKVCSATSFDFYRFDEFLDDHERFASVYITHFQCKKHYNVVMDILNLLQKNCHMNVITLMSVGEQDHITLCAVAAKMRIMNLSSYRIVGQPMHEYEIAANKTQIEMFSAQLRAQERGLYSAIRAKEEDLAQLQIVRHSSLGQSSRLID